MRSIPRPSEAALPDFCNLGVMLRVLLLANVLLAFAVLVQSRPLSGAGLVAGFLAAAALVEPVVIASLAVLCPLRRFLRPLGYAVGALAVAMVEVALVAGVRLALPGPHPGAGVLAHDAVLALAGTAAALYYFHLRDRAFSPALVEARLSALQARIRPHFLYNSLNAVLGLVRTEPRRAEAALEDLADLFRGLLRETRRLVPLAEEIDLCRRYLAIEALRLGERLTVRWDVDAGAGDAAMPPLILQPLVENAVHHGIEPADVPGTVHVTVSRRGAVVEIVITNPLVDPGAGGTARTGNHMALDNVRERLALHFDVEARLERAAGPDAYRVRIVVPYRRYAERPED